MAVLLVLLFNRLFDKLDKMGRLLGLGEFGSFFVGLGPLVVLEQ